MFLIFLLHFVTDIVINIIQKNELFGQYMIINYLIDQINGFLSKYIVQKEDQYVNIGLTCILTSCNFWFLSNLGVFFTNGM